MASPGAGKTSLITRTVEALRDQLKIGAIDGDIATTLDADRIAELGVPTVQVNTGGACHMDAVMLKEALPKIPLAELDLLIVENVGNLVCPASFDLGTHRSVLIASIPEGDDKPSKYPALFREASAVVLNKVDLAPYVPFDAEFFRSEVRRLNGKAPLFELSASNGDGFDPWLRWLEESRERLRAAGPQKA